MKTLKMSVGGLAVVLGGLSSAQTTERVSLSSGGVQGDRFSYEPSISADGRFVAFASVASDLVSGDTNGFSDVFVRDRQTGVTERISVSTGGAEGDDDSVSPSISADGRYVAYVSFASNLVGGDTNGTYDVFVRDRQLATTTLVSIDSAGIQANGSSDFPSISADGRFVSFDSNATNLVTGDTNNTNDVFVHDRLTGATTLVSVSSGGVQGDDASYKSWISGDGRFVVFNSGADTLVAGDTNGSLDVFVHDRLTGTTIRASVDSTGTEGNGTSGDAALSMDGRLVVFTSDATNLVPGDTNFVSDVFVHDLQTGATRRVSLSSSDAEGNGPSGWLTNGRTLAISSDGRFVAFPSYATNLVSGPGTGAANIYVHDLLTGATERASVNAGRTEGNGTSGFCSISAEGRFSAFDDSSTNLVRGDTNGCTDVFVRDRGVASPFTPFCFGDGIRAACPCDNFGAPGHGCENSSGTGGALLTVSGVASLSGDTVQFTSAGEPPTSLSIALQGDAAVEPVSYGDGLRCTGGVLKRLFVRNAAGGSFVAPQGSDPSVSAASMTAGDPITSGSTRIYQVYYRDPTASFCPSPGSTFNISNAVAVAWGQ